jgi:hypothetical protein
MGFHPGPRGVTRICHIMSLHDGNKSLTDGIPEPLQKLEATALDRKSEFNVRFGDHGTGGKWW